ncbi:MAG: hypothetical protein ACTSQK_05440 [Candidatus Heimdallarchaeota archaeon]
MSEIETENETEEVPMQPTSTSNERAKIQTVYVDRQVDQEDDTEKQYKDRMIIRSYSSMILFIPSFIAALICGIVQMSLDLTITTMTYEEISTGSGYGNIIGIIFLVVFSLNLILIAFDFNRATTIILSILFVALIAVLLLVNAYTGFLTSGGGTGIEMSIYLSYWVYYILAALLLFIIGFTMLGPIFNYYIIEGNELIHHKGFGGGIERYPAAEMSIVKEFPDLIELLIFRSGTLILTPIRTNRAIVLKNVFRINKKVSDMNEILSRLKVDIN